MTQHFYDPPIDRRSSRAIPLFGFVTQMLIDGGGWNGETVGVDVMHKARTIEYFPDEFVTEPDQHVSNFHTTAKLFKRMIVAGWSKKQVHAALSHPGNRGGEFYRFKQFVGEDLLHDLYEGTTTAEPPTASPGNAVGGTAEDPDGYEYEFEEHPFEQPVPEPVKRTFTIRHKHALDLLAWLQRTGTATRTQVQHESPLSPKVAVRYLDNLAGRGLVTITDEPKYECRDGKKRRARVVRVADPETVALNISADDVPPEDRVFWEFLQPVSRGLPEFTMTLDELLNDTQEAS